MVEGLEGVKVTQIAAGTHHTVICTTQGGVIIFGVINDARRRLPLDVKISIESSWWQLQVCHDVDYFDCEEEEEEEEEEEDPQHPIPLTLTLKPLTRTLTLALTLILTLIRTLTLTRTLTG